MTIQIDCPRCKSKVSLSEELVGQYAFCEHCRGRIWVPETAAGDATQKTATPDAVVGTVTADQEHKLAQEQRKGPPATPPSAEAPQPPPAITPPEERGGTASVAPPGGGSTSPVEPPRAARPLASSSRVAKFISTDVAQSRLEMASDGKLPELELAKEAGKTQTKTPQQAGNQWRLVLMVCGSLILSTLLLIVGPEPESKNTESGTERAIAIIETKYLGPDEGTRKRYQEYLRDALLARSQDDRQKEQRYYRKVLHLLRGEHLDRDRGEKGLTGQRYFSTDRSLPSDEELENLLSTLLKNNR